jgi:nucleoside-diphosphate-sugar epimerase
VKILVLGGTGVISRCIVEELLSKNHEVAIFNRGTKSLAFSNDIEQIIGNKANSEEFAAVMKDKIFDVVIDMICFNEEDARTTVNVFGDRVEQIIITSSVAAYKRPYNTVPTIEAAEELFDDPAFGYAYEKAQVERYLQQEIIERNLPITIIRPSLTYGSGAANIGVLRQNYGIIDRMRNGKPLVMFGDGTTPWIFTFAQDLAKGYAGVAGNKKTYGEAYHITSDEVHIWDDLYLEFGKIIGVDPKIIHFPSELLMKAAPNLCTHLYYEKSYAGLFDNSKIKRDVPGFKAEISLHDGLKKMVEWYESVAYPVDAEIDQLEDQLVSIYNEWEKQISNLYLK